MRATKRYEMKKIYLYEDLFKKEEIKVGYLNINGLLEAFHAEYLNVDHNLNELDLLAIADTRLTEGDNEEILGAVLSNWKILHRFDAPDGKKHMGLILMTQTKNHIQSMICENFSKERDGQIQIQGIAWERMKHSFSFVYNRTTPSKNEAKFIEEESGKYDYLLGDLNLDKSDEN